ncbi:unnamed protein product [Prorocentrum cordatum]|uniref:Uncharacterized protein n=1 Tax=Prorocentrum cordatum TaxID=2364126 RepID=A0ABN9V208_9DINO|nr:unnamed protein product [Polarella glacialis]
MQWGRASRHHSLFVGVPWVASLRAPRGFFPRPSKGAAAFRVSRASPQVHLARGLPDPPRLQGAFLANLGLSVRAANLHQLCRAPATSSATLACCCCCPPLRRRTAPPSGQTSRGRRRAPPLVHLAGSFSVSCSSTSSLLLLLLLLVPQPRSSPLTTTSGEAAGTTCAKNGTDRL